jgi:hypothetical protein
VQEKKDQEKQLADEAIMVRGARERVSIVEPGSGRRHREPGTPARTPRRVGL